MLATLAMAFPAALGLKAPVFDHPGFVATTQENMNGIYPFSTTPDAPGPPGKMPKHFSDYPGGVEAFDVYSPPMSTLYSQVWWRALAPTSLLGPLSSCLLVCCSSFCRAEACCLTLIEPVPSSPSRGVELALPSRAALADHSAVRRLPGARRLG